MNKKVFICQNGTIPEHRIIEELERRGGVNKYELCGDSGGGSLLYYIHSSNLIDYDSVTNRTIIEGYTELLYDKETDSFYEKNECADCINDKGCINCHNGDMKETYWGEKAPSAQEAAKSMRMQAGEAKEALFGNGGSLMDLPFGAYDSKLEGYEWTIPEGYEATIEEGKIIVKKKWTIKDAKPGDIICSPNGSTHDMTLIFKGWEGSPFTFVFAYAGTDITGKLQITDGHWLINKESRLATQKEKDYLFQKIDEAGYEWDAEKLELRKKKWQPKEGDTVWFCWFSFETSFCVDFAIYKSGENEWFYFQTKEECQAFCDKLNEAIFPIIEKRRKEV